MGAKNQPLSTVEQRRPADGTAANEPTTLPAECRSDLSRDAVDDIRAFHGHEFLYEARFVKMKVRRALSSVG